MKVPIPSDWDGQDWFCLQVEWPNSPEWVGLLTGILTLLTRGRYWDEKTGSIIDVQNIAREIFDRSYPFVSCEGEPVPIPPHEVVCGSVMVLNDCEDCMACITDITIEDGILYKWYGPCCKIAVGSISTIEVPPPPGEDDTVSPSEWPCNKARGMANEFDAVMKTGVARLIGTSPGIVDPVAPYLTAWIDANSQIPWNRDGVTEALQWYVGGEAEVNSAVTADDFDDWMACTWRPVLLSTSGLSSNEFDAMFAVTTAMISNRVGRFTALMMNAAGYSYHAWNASSYYLETGNCECPADEGPLDPVAGGWYLGQLRTLQFSYDDVKENSFTHQCLVPEHDVYGLFHWGEIVSQSGTFNRYAKEQDSGGCAHDYQLTAHAATANFQPGNMYMQMDDSPATTLYDAMGTALTKQYDTLAGRSKIIASPIMVGGLTGQVMFFAEAGSGGSGVFKVSYRLVHNNLSPSH